MAESWLQSSSSIAKKWVEVDVYNAPIVRRAYKEYATGVSSLRLIRKRIKADYGVVLSTSQLDLILKNQLYKGEMLYKGVLYPHKYKRIVSDRLYEKAKAVREGYNIKPAI